MLIRSSIWGQKNPFVFQILSQIETGVTKGHFNVKLFNSKVHDTNQDLSGYFLRVTGDRSDGNNTIGVDFYTNGNHYTWNKEHSQIDFTGGLKIRFIINPDNTYALVTDDKVIGSGDIIDDFTVEGENKLDFSENTIEAVSWDGDVTESEFDGIFAAYYILGTTEQEADDYYQHIIDTITSRKNAEMDAAFSSDLQFTDGDGQTHNLKGAESMDMSEGGEEAGVEAEVEPEIKEEEASKEDL